ncbi:GNAT family N-acetyltransferase [Glycomyces niveus]|uniref:GNAT family N-acetyltransferase n=1 Tax=Glycomyces niveus TaxID=2820287 RepID=A0ABS3U8K8_9ACTN|nr:GNAT family N-acetyltransferase [Glycomyces sp. NEAU-S30]MBO3735114.1 GNAT family N-acetyltransferase [Glycomyces sp. NEAU-S30]
MTNARHAEIDDVPEIVRLREVMLSHWIDMSDESWKPATVEVLRRRMSEDKPTIGITVIDAPEGEGLAACAVGTISERLPGPFNPSGRYGWIFNVVTDPQWRKRGFSRVCTTALLAWFEDQNVQVLELLASDQGQGLYEELGFTVSPEPAMRFNSYRR